MQTFTEIFVPLQNFIIGKKMELNFLNSYVKTADLHQE